MTTLELFTKKSNAHIIVEDSSLNKVAAYIALSGRNGPAYEWLSLDEAEHIHKTLGKLINEYKVANPEPRNIDLIKAFPVGTQFTVKSPNSEPDEEPAKWIRTFKGVSGEYSAHANWADVEFAWDDCIITKIEETN